MAGKQEDVVKRDDTKREGITHKAAHQETAKQEATNHQIIHQEGDKQKVTNHQVIHQEDAKQEGINYQVAHQEHPKQEAVELKPTKKEVVPQDDIKQEPDAAVKEEDIVNQQSFLKQVASAKEGYFNEREGVISQEDDDYGRLTSPEELKKLPDLFIGPILPNLYISRASCSIDPAILQEHRITSIISITTEFKPEWESPAIRSLVPVERHLLLPADDNMVMNLLPFFEPICDWIDEQIETHSPTAACDGKGDNGKNNVLVHCCAAVSRSPAICMAYWLRNEYASLDKRKGESLKEIYRDFDKMWYRTWFTDTSTFFKQLQVWFDTGYQIWEDEEKTVPKWEYKRFLEIVRGPEMKALQEIWEEATGESGAWREGELGLTVVGVKDYQSGDVKTTTWDEAKEIIEGIPKEKTTKQSTKTIDRYVCETKMKQKEGSA